MRPWRWVRRHPVLAGGLLLGGLLVAGLARRPAARALGGRRRAQARSPPCRSSSSTATSSARSTTATAPPRPGRPDRRPQPVPLGARASCPGAGDQVDGLRTLTEAAADLGEQRAAGGRRHRRRPRRGRAASRPPGSACSTRSSSELDRIEAEAAAIDLGEDRRWPARWATPAPSCAPSSTGSPSGSPRPAPGCGRSSGCSRDPPATSSWPPTTPRCAAAPACRCPAGCSPSRTATSSSASSSRPPTGGAGPIDPSLVPGGVPRHLPAVPRGAELAADRGVAELPDHRPDLRRHERDVRRLRSGRRRARGRHGHAAPPPRGDRPGRGRRRHATPPTTSSSSLLNENYLRVRPTSDDRLEVRREEQGEVATEIFEALKARDVGVGRALARRCATRPPGRHLLAYAEDAEVQDDVRRDRRRRVRSTRRASWSRCRTSRPTSSTGTSTRRSPSGRSAPPDRRPWTVRLTVEVPNPERDGRHGRRGVVQRRATTTALHRALVAVYLPEAAVRHPHRSTVEFSEAGADPPMWMVGKRIFIEEGDVGARGHRVLAARRSTPACSCSRRRGCGRCRSR